MATGLTNRKLASGFRNDSIAFLTLELYILCYYPARARARRACALRVLGLLLADGAPTVGRGKTF